MRATDVLHPISSWPWKFDNAVVAHGHLAVIVSGWLAGISAAASALTFFVPEALRGTPVMIGCCRGTALVMLVCAVPALIVSMALAAQGSVRAVVTWLGAIGYLLYNAVLLLFATPFNAFFLFYVATLALSIWSAITLIAALDLDRFAARFAQGRALRGVAIYTAVLVALNAVAWLATVIPSVLSSTPGAFMDGSGLTTNPVYVNDLGFWLPLGAVGAWLLWHRHRWGFLIVGAFLSTLTLEGISVAVDQWFGATADPSHPILASMAVVPLFAVLTVIGLVPLYFYFRALRPR